MKLENPRKLETGYVEERCRLSISEIRNMAEITKDIVDEVVVEYISNPEDVSYQWLGEFVDEDTDFDEFFHQVATRLDGLAERVRKGEI